MVMVRGRRPLQVRVRRLAKLESAAWPCYPADNWAGFGLLSIQTLQTTSKSLHTWQKYNRKEKKLLRPPPPTNSCLGQVVPCPSQVGNGRPLVWGKSPLALVRLPLVLI